MNQARQRTRIKRCPAQEKNMPDEQRDRRLDAPAARKAAQTVPEPQMLFEAEDFCKRL
jgi:hypothetical protein